MIYLVKTTIFRFGNTLRELDIVDAENYTEAEEITLRFYKSMYPSDYVDVTECKEMLTRENVR